MDSVGQTIATSSIYLNINLFQGGAISNILVNRVSYFEGVYRNLHIPAVLIGGTFALMAILLSSYLLFQHLASYTNPAEQKWIIGVIFMVPVYASESIISLWKSKFSIECDILRNCYEAFALYCFGAYLVACLGGEERVAELLEKGSRKEMQQLLEKDEEKGISDHSSFHDFICQPRIIGQDLYTIQKFGLVQYMILKTLCAFLALLLEIFGVYGDGEFKWFYGYPYITVVINFSQMWALYCLVQFYNVTHHRLEPIKPLAKFISFKAIVFATWWQGVGIALICYLGILPKEGKIQNGIQDFLICIEMAIAAIAHIYVFPAEPYRYMPVSEYGRVTSIKTKAKYKVDNGDKKGNPAVVETETKIEAPGTSVTESVQDVVLGGGEHVVKDVALTISQAIEPVEKGVTKIQETLNIAAGSDKEDEGKAEVEADANVTEKFDEKGDKIEVSEHIEEEIDDEEHSIEIDGRVTKKIDEGDMKSTVTGTAVSKFSD